MCCCIIDGKSYFVLPLVQLHRAKESENVQYLPLANVIPDPKEGTKCVVAGWGAVEIQNPETSDVLRSADVAVFERKTCNSPKYYNSKITRDMVCAGTKGKKTQDTWTVGLTIVLHYLYCKPYHPGYFRLSHLLHLQ